MKIRPWEPLADLESGRLGRPSISDKMPVPVRIERSGDEIAFDFSGPVRGVAVPTDLLERFLTADTDAALVAFAKRFGPLAVFRDSQGDLGWPDPERLADWCDDPHRESLASWLHYQAQVSAVLGLIAAYREKTDPTIEKLVSFYQSTGRSLEPKVLELAGNSEAWRRGLALRAGLFYTRVLADACHLCLGPRVNGLGKIELVLQDAGGNLPGGSISLFGALTVQLMTAFVGRGWAICDSCHRPYSPTRRPAAGRKHYCSGPDCGVIASWRDSKRKLRS